MPLKNQRIVSDYITWYEFTQLLLKLQRDKKYKFSLLIAFGGFCGLRISDILNLKWSDVLGVNEITVSEKKTNKQRTIKINAYLQDIINTSYKALKPKKPSLPIFSQRLDQDKVISIQYINKRLKKFKAQYKLSLKNFSTHSLRKTFGRQIWKHNDYSEKSLILLSKIFNHSDTQITRRYLGITEDEISEVYESLTL